MYELPEDFNVSDDGTVRELSDDHVQGPRRKSNTLFLRAQRVTAGLEKQSRDR